MEFCALTAEHWPAVRAIYEQSIATGKATFETQAPGWAAWDAGHLPHSRLVDAPPGPADTSYLLTSSPCNHLT